jgi:AcrR family transcriptional regulator
MTQEPGRLEQKKARTQAAIAAAATELFLGQGFDATSMQQIAELAETGVGTVYGYFASKEDLLREVVRLRAQQEVARFQGDLSSGASSIDQVLRAVDRMFVYGAENRPLLAAALKVTLGEGASGDLMGAWVLQAIRLLIESGIQKGEIRPLPVDTTARLVFSASVTAILGVGPWRERDSPASVQDEIRVIVRELLTPR